MARRHDAWLMVDEAHALGVLGATGRGSFEHAGVDPAGVDIWMGTLSKTLCACGGYIAGRKSLVDYLRHSAPGFVYSVGLPPALAGAAIAALQAMQEDSWRVLKLQENGALFRRLARDAGLDTGTSAGFAIVPVIVGSSVGAGKLSMALFARGVNVQPILFPAVPESSARLRFFLSSEHSEADIRFAVEATVAALAGAAPVELAE
jgi:7-keto-8-aminopelargonate synthetase-like enzyme